MVLTSSENKADGLIDCDPTARPEFKQWFGQSKVVNAQGLPLLVYHGPTKGRNFDQFRVPAFFTSCKAYAENYLDADDDAGPIEVYLSMANPITFDAQVHELGADAEELANDPSWVDEQVRAGHDGLIVIDGEVVDYIVFDPASIQKMFCESLIQTMHQAGHEIGQRITVADAADQGLDVPK